MDRASKHRTFTQWAHSNPEVVVSFIHDNSITFFNPDHNLFLNLTDYLIIMSKPIQI